MDKIITVLGYKKFITEMSDAPDCLSSFFVTLISTDLMTCMGIDLDEISLTATFPCDPDFFCSRSLNNFG